MGTSLRPFFDYFSWESFIALNWPASSSRGVPNDPNNPSAFLNAGGAFPVNGATNTTMETYFQTQNNAAGAGGNSCMSRHYRAGQSDFSWGLNRRAH